MSAFACWRSTSSRRACRASSRAPPGPVSSALVLFATQDCPLSSRRLAVVVNPHLKSKMKTKLAPRDGRSSTVPRPSWLDPPRTKAPLCPQIRALDNQARSASEDCLFPARGREETLCQMPRPLSRSVRQTQFALSSGHGLAVRQSDFHSTRALTSPDSHTDGRCGGDPTGAWGRRGP